MTMTEFLDRVNADRDMRQWCEGKTPEQAWNECENGSWLLRVAARLLPKKTVVKVCCAVARQALAYVPEGEDRPRICIETIEAWTRGEATIEQVMAARKDAFAARWDATDDCGTYNAAIYAINAGRGAGAAIANDIADDAGVASDPDAVSDSFNAARKKSLADSADIVRQHITWDMISEAL